MDFFGAPLSTSDNLVFNQQRCPAIDPSTIKYLNKDSSEKLMLKETMISPRPSSLKPRKDSENSQVLEGEKESHSRDCLKFCRKLSSLIQERLTLPTQLITHVLTFNSDLILTLSPLLNIPQLRSSDIIMLQKLCLQNLWTEFRNLLSYSKNKKICLVKQEHWNLLFDKKTSTEYLKDIAKKLSSTWNVLEGRLLLENAAFCEILAQILYCSNKLIVIVLILNDASEKGAYLRGLKTRDNFFLMIQNADYLSFYNHSSGKFALECCGKCKVCKAKGVPENFEAILYNSRKRAQAIAYEIDEMVRMYEYSKFEALLYLQKLSFNQLWSQNGL